MPLYTEKEGHLLAMRTHDIRVRRRRACARFLPSAKGFAPRRSLRRLRAAANPGWRLPQQPKRTPHQLPGAPT